MLEILDSLILKNAVISVDAMNTQKKIAEKIIDNKGYYVMALKKNHRTFRNEIEAYFHKMARENKVEIEQFEEVNSERSRIDERIYRKLKVSDWLAEAKQWKGVNMRGKLKSAGWSDSYREELRFGVAEA